MMNNYIKIVVDIPEEEKKEVVIAQLSSMQFDGFEETDTQLTGYIIEENFIEGDVNDLIKRHDLTYSKSVISPQNWNALWESNFEPVEVDDFCSIRADFHTANINTRHEIIITPKMSFGTGHHATTYLMINEMRNLDFAGKTVADFGTGTGILAILAEKLGSKQICAIDNDDWSIENAEENVVKNNCCNIDIVKLDSFSSNKSFDIILANINKNVILDNLEALFSKLRKGGTLLLSGLLREDEKDIVSACKLYQVDAVSVRERNKWICIVLKK